MTRGVPVLLFVPGITSSESNNATRIAEVIAASQSRRLPGTYSVKVEHPEVDHSKASVIAPGGEAVLAVVEVDYRPRLAEADVTGRWALLRSGRFALLGILRLLAARRGAKVGKHRWFLLAGFAMVLVLILAFVILAGAALAVVLGGGANPTILGAVFLSTGGILYWLRGKLLDSGKHVREQVRYFERDREAASVALALDVAIDRVLEQEPPPPAIHILAYSFGSIVTLDALFSRIPIRAKSEDRTVSAITSLVTIGAPVDFVRQFYPAYFADRVARRKDLPWTNLFLPEDLLGSNFLDDNDHSGFESPPADQGVFTIAGVAPRRSVAVGHARLTLRSLLSLEGFRVHGDYWDKADRANLLEPVIDSWFVPAAGPSPPPPVTCS